MHHGITNKRLIGSFGLRDAFDIPAGTPVVFGQADCDGAPFPYWALAEDTARALSGNAHDSAHRFVMVPTDHVTPE